MSIRQTPVWFVVGFACTAVAAVVFLVLTIIGFSRSPEEAARTRVERAVKKYDAELKAHAATKKELYDESNARKQADKDLKAARTEFGEKEAVLEKVQSDRDNWREQYKELKAAKDERARIEERARAAFESIMKRASGAEGPEKKLATLEGMREASLSALADTPYMKRLEGEISRVKRAVAEEKRAAETKAKRDAIEAYEGAMRRLKMAKGHDAEMTVLRAAREELAGTPYEVRIDSQIKARETVQTSQLARSIYDEVIKKVKGSPRAYEENLAALEDAMTRTKGSKYEALLRRQVEARRKTVRDSVARVVYEEVMKKTKASRKAYEENLAALEEAMRKTEGTRYEATLGRLVEARRKSLARDIAAAAYSDLAVMIKRGPTNFDDNIAAAEEALAKAKGTRYEAKVRAMVESQKARKLDAAGRKAYDEALAKVKSSTDRDENIRALEDLKVTAAGSAWEAKIDKFLRREKVYKERGR